MMNKKKNKSHGFKRALVVTGILCILIFVSAYPLYLLGERSFYAYFDKWGDKLVSLDKRGLLSKKQGAAWQDVLTEEAMEYDACNIIRNDTGCAARNGNLVIEGVAVSDYPSLSIVA